MSTYLDSVRRRKLEQRSGLFSFSDYLGAVASYSFGGNTYTGPVTYTYGPQKSEAPEHSFDAYVSEVYKRDGVVFAVMAARELLLASTRFKFRSLSDKSMFGTPALGRLEKPWPTGTTGDLLRRMEQDGSIAGNGYYVDANQRLRRLLPGHVALLIASDSDPEDPAFAWDCDVAGIVYNTPKGRQPTYFLPGDYVHYTPNPDPSVHFRGMSWMTPVIQEVMSDRAITTHKKAFFDNAATPNLAIKLPESVVDPDQYKKIREAMEESRGAENAYKTLYLMAGADITAVGMTGALDFKSIQGTGETRICAAGRIHPAIVGVSEGLAGSSLNAGNLGQARRMAADGYYYPTIQDICSVVAPLISVPSGAELWYDSSDVPFLREDQKDAAEIMQAQVQAVRQGVEAGFDPDAVVDAVVAMDLGKLKGNHSGLTSVQLQPPMNGETPSGDTPDLPNA